MTVAAEQVALSTESSAECSPGTQRPAKTGRMIAWTMMNPLRELKAISPREMAMRLALFVTLIVSVLSAVIYTKFVLPNQKSDPPVRPPAVEASE